VPRFLSYVIRGASRVLGGIGMLLTPMTAGPREFDEYYGQPLFFPRDERDDSDRRDNRDAGPTGVGPVTLGPPSLDTLPEVELTGARRPDTPYSFADLALPFAPSFPGLDVGGITFPSAGPQPNSETAPQPRQSPAPSPEFLNVPTPKPAPEPFLDLSPSLDPFPEALPRPQAPPRDVITLTPPPLGSPEAPIFGAIDPVPPLGPIPKEDLDRCRCPKPKEKKKKSKDRDECLAGGYVENSKSTRKRPLRVVDCATGKTIRKYKPKPKKKTAKKPKLRSV
jgi:hypothetical protein